LGTLSAHGAGKQIAKPGSEGGGVVPGWGGELQQAWSKVRDERAIALTCGPDQELISHMQLLAHGSALFWRAELRRVRLSVDPWIVDWLAVGRMVRSHR
jgi:hypothetical protein